MDLGIFDGFNFGEFGSKLDSFSSDKSLYDIGLEATELKEIWESSDLETVSLYIVNFNVNIRSFTNDLEIGAVQYLLAVVFIYRRNSSRLAACDGVVVAKEWAESGDLHRRSSSKRAKNNYSITY